MLFRSRKVFDTISDNAANAGVVMGGRAVRPTEIDLRKVPAVLYRNGVIEESGVSAAVSGSVSSVGAATAAIASIDTQINNLNTARATWGAVQNRFSSVVQTLSVASENAQASRGRIMDADFAKETANMTRAQILQQAGTAMVSQANSMPNNVLSLLQ